MFLDSTCALNRLEDEVISKNAAFMRQLEKETKGIKEGISEAMGRSKKRGDEEHKRERPEDENDACIDRERHLKALEEVKKGGMKNTKERPEDENDACIDRERH